MTPATSPPAEGGADVARAGLVGLLVVQILIGYEWLVSGVTKLVDGGFPRGLAAELRGGSQAAPSFYRSFLDSVVIPHGQLFGYLVEIGELIGGAALIAAAVVWLVRWNRLSVTWQTGVLAVTAVASLIGIFMNVNFHLANGGTHPWLIPPSGFDEGVDLDSLMPAIQLVLFVVATYGLRALRRSRYRNADHRRPGGDRSPVRLPRLLHPIYPWVVSFRGDRSMTQTATYAFPGMHCAHCERAVKAEVGRVVGVHAVEVDLDAKLVTVRGVDVSDGAVRDAIDEAGYEVVL